MKKILLLCLLTWGASAQALLINPFVDGADMAGIQVTVTFDDNSTDTATWAATGGDSGAASGSNWSLTESGDTLGGIDTSGALFGVWTLSNTASGGTTAPPSITKLRVDGWMARIVFDVYMDLSSPLDDVGTPGSSQGRPFTADNSNNPVTVTDIWTTYSGLTDNTKTPENTTDVTYLNLISSPDLFGSFEVTLGSSGLAGGQSFDFMIDTDQIPEPPLYGLLALGLVGWAARRRGAVSKV